MDENAVGNIVLGCAIKVHKALGPGLLEGAYEACLAHEIAKAGLACQRQIKLRTIIEHRILRRAAKHLSGRSSLYVYDEGTNSK